MKNEASFQELSIEHFFAALGTGFMFSFTQYCQQLSPRFTPVACFPVATAQRPGGPKAQRSAARGSPRPGGLEARWPSPDFQQFFCPAVNPRACTDLHRVSACKMDDGEFSSVPF